MKKVNTICFCTIIFFAYCLLSIGQLYSQAPQDSNFQAEGRNITIENNVGINTTTPESKLHIKGSENTTQLIIDGGTGQSNNNPLFKLRDNNGNDLLWLHSDLATNIFMGVGAGSAGGGGNANTFVGGQSGSLNTSGNNNTGLGYATLNVNTSGSENTATGVGALNYNSTGNYNTATGSSALYYNTTGSHNTANGYNALIHNTGGHLNTAIGEGSLLLNAIGQENSAFGFHSLQSNISGSWNSAFGNYALTSCTGILNSAIGYNAGANITSGTENIALGFNSNVPNADGSFQIRMGNSAITYAGIQVAWTITSDRRWKSDIQESNLGLDFISRLKPVSYYRTNDESKKREYGFIAQDLEEALNASGATDNGIISKDDYGWYGVRYNDLMTPMVKAIQELSDQNKTQQQLIDQQNQVIENLLSRIDALEKKQ